MATRKPTVPFLVDSLAPKLKRLSTLEKLQKEVKLLKEQLVTLLELKPTQEKLVSGRRYAGTISACGWERTITDKESLIDFLGEERYIAESKILLGRLDELVTEGVLTEAQLQAVVTKLQTGHRKFMFVPKEKALPKAA